MAFGDIKGTKTGTATSITASLACATGTNFAVVVGDLIVTLLAEQAAKTVTACTDNLTNTYTALGAGADAGTVTGRAFYTRVTNAGTISSVTFTATASSNNCVGLAVCFEGPFEVSPLDANPTTIINDNTTPYTCPATGTLAQANEKIVNVIVHNANPTLTATAPNLKAVELNTASILKAAIGHQTVASTASVTPAWTSSVTPTASGYGTASFKKTLVVHTTMPAATGSFALAGQAAAFPIRRRITLDPARTSSLITLSGGNLTATKTSAGAPNYYASSLSGASPSGAVDLYAEATFSGSFLDPSVGVSNATIGDSDGAGSANWLGWDANSIGLYGNSVYHNGSVVGSFLTTGVVGDIIGVWARRVSGTEVAFWFTNPRTVEVLPNDEIGFVTSLGSGPLYFGFTLTDGVQGTANFDDPFAPGQDFTGWTKWDGAPIISASVTHYTLTADAGTLALTQLPATLVHRRVYSMAAAKGTLTLAGTVTNLRRSYSLAAVRGTFALTGVDAALSSAAAYKLTADKGTFALTGIAATLREARVLIASPKAFAVAGVDVTLRQVRKYQLPATPGAFVLTGFAAALSKAGALVMLAARGTFTLAGVDAALHVALAPVTHYTLAALPGMFVVSGRAAVLSVGRVPSVPQFEILQFGRPVYHMPGRW